MNVYQIITDRIIKSLEQGVIPWRRPWRVAGQPRNFISMKRYRGINVLLLATQGYGSPYWLTYKQAAEHAADRILGICRADEEPGQIREQEATVSETEDAALCA